MTTLQPRRAWRAARVFTHILWGLVLALCLIGIRLLAGRRLHARIRDRIACRWLGKAARCVGARCEWRGQRVAGPALIVANHVSWLDILVLGEVFGPGFVSKAEVAQWPLLGWLARQAGTLFLQRGSRGSADRVLDQMTWQLASGRPAIVFPEGTTTDGSQVLRFKPRLFQAAVRTQVPVQPVSLRYRTADGSAGPVPFLGEQSFFTNLWAVLALRQLTVEVVVNAPLTLRHDPRLLAEQAHSRVVRSLEGAPSPRFASDSVAL